MQQLNKVYLSLGSNIQPRHYFLTEAVRLLVKGLGQINAQSLLYESESWGFHAETPFLNSVLELHTALNPFELLQHIKQIEKTLGRTEKGKPYRSRKIDIDIIAFNNDIISTEHLSVPHPLMTQRRFVLMPLSEIAPDWIHPVLLKTSSQLLKECTDTLKVTVIKNIAADAL